MERRNIANERSVDSMTVRFTRTHIWFSGEAAHYLNTYPSVRLVIQPSDSILLFVKGNAIKPAKVKREIGVTLLDEEGKLESTVFLPRLFSHMKRDPSDEYSASVKTVYLECDGEIALEVDLNAACPVRNPETSGKPVESYICVL